MPSGQAERACPSTGADQVQGVGEVDDTLMEALARSAVENMLIGGLGETWCSATISRCPTSSPDLSDGRSPLELVQTWADGHISLRRLLFEEFGADEDDGSGEGNAVRESQLQVHQAWIDGVLGALAGSADRPLRGDGGRLSAGAIVRNLGLRMQQSASAPGLFDLLLAAPATPGAQSSSSARSCDADGGGWQPPRALPACGLRLSRCSSADQRLASAARRRRVLVPGLDLGKVHMGEDDEEEDEDTQFWAEHAVPPEAVGPLPVHLNVPRLDLMHMSQPGGGPANHPLGGTVDPMPGHGGASLSVGPSPGITGGHFFGPGAPPRPPYAPGTGAVSSKRASAPAQSPPRRPLLARLPPTKPVPAARPAGRPPGAPGVRAERGLRRRGDGCLRLPPVKHAQHPAGQVCRSRSLVVAHLHMHCHHHVYARVQPEGTPAVCSDAPGAGLALPGARPGTTEADLGRGWPQAPTQGTSSAPARLQSPAARDI